jgi:hypothetical protein
VAEQVGNPLGIVDIGLATGHGLDVLRIDDQDCDGGLQEIGAWLPVFAGTLHRNMVLSCGMRPSPHWRRSAVIVEKVRVCVQSFPRSSEVRQQTTTVFFGTSMPVQCVDITSIRTSLRASGRQSGRQTVGQMPVQKEDSQVRASRFTGEDHSSVCPHGIRVRLLVGLHTPVSGRPRDQPLLRRGYHMFMGRCAQSAWRSAG